MLNRIIFVLSLIGLGVSVFLAYEYARPIPIDCPIGGTGCEIVRKSAYSSLLGIPLPYYGITYYSILALISILSSSIKMTFLKRTQFMVATFGLLFSIYLTALEEFVIKAYCFWCVTSAIISTVIFVVALLSYKNFFRKKKHENTE